MIQIKKAAKPQVLTDHGAEWTAELLAILANGDQPASYQAGRYNRPEIKHALRQETHGKCAYCESKYGHVAYGDIEHISPRKEAPELSFEWENLTIACDVCNTGKGSVAYGVLIDPYAEDPSQFLQFAGPMVIAALGDAKAEASVSRLKLNRPDLVETRKQRIQYLRECLSNIVRIQDANRRQVLLQDLRDNELSEAGEYSAASRTFYSMMAPGLGIA